MVSSSALFKLLLFVVLLTAAATTLRCLRVATSTTILTASQSSTFSGVGPVEPRLRTAAPRVFKVLLVSSNPRSGSSFVGDVLTSVSSSSFYFFEPLRWLFSPVPKLGGKEMFEEGQMLIKKVHLKKNKNCAVLQAKRPLNKASQEGNVSTSEKLEVVKDFLNCSFGSERYLEWLSSEKAREFVFVKPERSLGLRFVDSRKQLEARAGRAKLAQWERRCRRSKLRLVKTIRLSAALALRVADDDDDGGKEEAVVKVLVLVRDPRATLNSMVSWTPDRWEDEWKEPRRLCGRILDDMEVVRKEEEMMPGGLRRIVFVRYEDFANEIRREGEVRRLVEFLGLPPEAVQTMLGRAKELSSEEEQEDETATKPVDVHEATEAQLKQYSRSHYWSVRRGAGFSPEGWRRTLSAAQLRDVQETAECAEVMDRLGYKRI